MNMEDRLWDYIDGAGSAEERSAVEQLIATHLDWRAKHKELLDVHLLMSNHLELDEPSLRFTQNVMEEISKYHIAPAAKTYINKRVIWGISTFFVLSMIGFLIYGFAQITWTSSDGSPMPFDITKVDFDKLNFGKFFDSTSTTAFLMINTVLGLFLLDMYLGKKKRGQQSEFRIQK